MYCFGFNHQRRRGIITPPTFSIDPLDFFGTICIITAALMFTSKKVSNPKFRRIALYSYIGSNAFFFPLFISRGLLFNVISQVVLFLINIRGLIQIRKELKNVK